MGHTKSKITKQTLADYTDIINHTSNTVFDKADITRENILNIIIIFKNQLVNNIRQYITNNTKNSQNWFIIAFSLKIPGASDVNEIMKLISEDIRNDSTMYNSVSEELENYNTLMSGYYDGTLKHYDRNVLAKTLAKHVIKNTIKIWTTNNTLNKLWQTTDQKLAYNDSLSQNNFTITPEFTSLSTFK